MPKPWGLMAPAMPKPWGHVAPAVPKPWGHVVPAVPQDQVGWRDPVHVVGHSMGGMVALRMASTLPQRVRSMTCISVTRGGWEAYPRTWKCIKCVCGGGGGLAGRGGGWAAYPRDLEVHRVWGREGEGGGGRRVLTFQDGGSQGTGEPAMHYMNKRYRLMTYQLMRYRIMRYQLNYCRPSSCLPHRHTHPPCKPYTLNPKLPHASALQTRLPALNPPHTPPHPHLSARPLQPTPPHPTHTLTLTLTHSHLSARPPSHSLPACTLCTHPFSAIPPASPPSPAGLHRYGIKAILFGKKPEVKALIDLKIHFSKSTLRSMVGGWVVHDRGFRVVIHGGRV